MKTLLFLLIGLPLMGQPVWVNKGEAPKGVIREGYRDTTSMRPALVGDGFYYYLPSQDVKVGDWVVLFRSSDGKKVLHVVTAANKRAILTSGLNCRFSDGWSPRSAIVGICLYVERQPVTSVAQVRGAKR